MKVNNLCAHISMHMEIVSLHRKASVFWEEEAEMFFPWGRFRNEECLKGGAQKREKLCVKCLWS